MMYEPQPGTFAARAVAYLRALPKGTEVASAVLADDLGQEPAQCCSLLATARDHGLLNARKKVGERVLLWSLGDGEPLQPEGLPGVEDDEGTAHKSAPPAVPGSVPGSVFDIAQGLGWKAPDVLERGAQSMVLDRIEFESLVHFLERTLLEKAA